MEYFKVCNESKFDDVYYLFSYYAINSKAICLTISKDNLTNELILKHSKALLKTLIAQQFILIKTMIYLMKCLLLSNNNIKDL